MSTGRGGDAPPIRSPAGLRAGSHDAYVVGYATVTTHDRPPGTAGVNYKVFLNQAPPPTTGGSTYLSNEFTVGGSSPYFTNELMTSSKPTPSRFDQSSYSYKSTVPTYHAATNYSLTTPPVAPSYPVGVSSYSSSASRRSRAPTRSASLPRLYTSTSSRKYTAASPSSVTLRMLAAGSSDGPTATAVEAWTPWRSARPPARRRDDDDEFYRRLREIRVRAPSPVSDDLDLGRRHVTTRGRTGGAPTYRAVSFSPNVIYTGKKIDHSLIPERPILPPLTPVQLGTYSTPSFADDNPSRYHLTGGV